MSHPKKTSIVKTARSLVGIPARGIRSSTSRAVDCVQFVEKVCQAEKIDLPDDIDRLYRVAYSGGNLVSILRSCFTPVALDDVEDGDLLVFKHGPFHNHFGIRTTLKNRPAFIHAHDITRRVVEVHIDSRWRSSLRRAFSLVTETHEEE